MCFNTRTSEFKTKGFQRFKLGNFTENISDESNYTAPIELLDKIDAGFRNDPNQYPASFDSEEYSYEFISKNPFYSLKLGPRLRLTYDINKFEKWPKLAQQIIASKAYKQLLIDNYGTTNGVHKCYIEKTFANGDEPQWHVDSVSEIGRLVFLLSDVGPNDAPLQYIDNSNLDTNSDFTKIKIHHLKQAESWTEYKHYSHHSPFSLFTGNKGESFFFDARGVHRATLSTNERSRYVLMISFTKKSFFNWFFDLNRGGWPSGTREI